MDKLRLVQAGAEAIPHLYRQVPRLGSGRQDEKLVGRFTEAHGTIELTRPDRRTTAIIANLARRRFVCRAQPRHLTMFEGGWDGRLATSFRNDPSPVHYFAGTWSGAIPLQKRG